MKHLANTTLCSLVAALAASATIAADYTWKGGSGEWTDPAMWRRTDARTSGYPAEEQDTATFPAADSDVVIASNMTIAGLTVSSEGKHVFRTTGASKNCKLTVRRLFPMER